MLEGPIGAAAFNNEFGRPALTGYFRTFEYAPRQRSCTGARLSQAGDDRGRHRQRAARARQRAYRSAARRDLIVIGGPAMLIGLGGGAASSMASGQSSSDLDFASVQRDNAEMQRRCQEVIDACASLGDANPIRLDPRRRCRRIVERAAGTGERRRTRRPLRDAPPAERRSRTRAARTLVQRSAGTLCAGRCARRSARCSNESARANGVRSRWSATQLPSRG